MSLLWLVCIITPCNNKRERQSLFSLKWSFSENSKYAESMFFEPKKIWSCYYREALFLFCWSKVFFAPNSQKLLVLVRLFLICRLKLLGPTIFYSQKSKRICCSFYQYLPMIKSSPSRYPNLTTSLLYTMVYIVS